MGRVQFVERNGRQPRDALRDQDSLDENKPYKMSILQIVTFGIGAGLWLFVMSHDTGHRIIM